EIDDYARGVTDAVVRDVDDLDRRITEAAAESGWTADRLGAVERNILRIAIHELDVGEIPPGAVIDEAVTLAKQYSTREAGRLVNGILDRLNKEAACVRAHTEPTAPVTDCYERWSVHEQ